MLVQGIKIQGEACVGVRLAGRFAAVNRDLLITSTLVCVRIDW